MYCCYQSSLNFESTNICCVVKQSKTSESERVSISICIKQEQPYNALKEHAIFKTILEQLLLYHLQTLCKTVCMYLLEGLMED